MQSDNREKERERKRYCVCMYACIHVCTMCACGCAFNVKEAGKQKGCVRMDERRKSRNKECERALHLAPDGLRTEYSFFPNSFCLFARQKKKEKNEFNAIKMDKI